MRVLVFHKGISKDIILDMETVKGRVIPPSGGYTPLLIR